MRISGSIHFQSHWGTATCQDGSRGLFMRVCAVLVPLLLACNTAAGQQTSGSITGVVQDPQRAAVPNAKVVLLNTAQGAVERELTTSAEGTFTIIPVPPGVYHLTVGAPGFKKYQKQGIELFAGDKVGVPPIVLELGAAAESVTVEATAVQLQTASAERSGVLTGRQMLNLGLADRNWVGLLRTMPGAISDPTTPNSLPSI